MYIEYAQILSTVHRVLDGKLYYEKSSVGRRLKRWKLIGKKEQVLYKASHINHPCSIWVRESSGNYKLLFKIYSECLKEFTYRYGKMHKSSEIRPELKKYS